MDPCLASRRPPRIGAPLLDIVAGLLCAVGVLSAYVDRERTRSRSARPNLAAPGRPGCDVYDGVQATWRLNPAPPALRQPQSTVRPVRRVSGGRRPDHPGRRPAMRRSGGGCARCSGWSTWLRTRASRPTAVGSPAGAHRPDRDSSPGGRVRNGHQRFALRRDGPINTIEALADPQVGTLDLVDRVPHPNDGTVNVIGVPITVSEMPTGHAADLGPWRAPARCCWGWACRSQIHALVTEGVVKA